MHKILKIKEDPMQQYYDRLNDKLNTLMNKIRKPVSKWSVETQTHDVLRMKDLEIKFKQQKLDLYVRQCEKLEGMHLFIVQTHILNLDKNSNLYGEYVNQKRQTMILSGKLDDKSQEIEMWMSEIRNRDRMIRRMERK